MLDATFLFAERPSAALHVGALLTFGPPADGPFDPAGFTALVEARLGLAPRLRQRVHAVPGRLGLPVWVDDDRFDLGYHLRHEALPAPGTERELRDLVATVMEAPLDRERPLWELTLVEGLRGGRTAAVMKIHHAVADGLSCLDVAAALLDPTPRPRPEPVPSPDWTATRAPSGLALAASAAIQGATTARSALSTAMDAVRSGGDIGTVASSALAAARRATRPPMPALHGGTGARRRHATVTAAPAEHRAVRRAAGGTVNDVVLTVVAGALRAWLQRRGQRLSATTTVRAMVPVGLRARDGSTSGNAVSAHLVDLPVGLAEPLARLAAVRAAMDERKRCGPVAVGALARLADVSPPLLHELGARVAGRHAGRLYDVLVTTMPGPPRRLYANGAPLQDLFPLVPLGRGQSVAFGVVSCGASMCYSVTADHDAVPDVDVLADALRESLAELVARACATAPAALPPIASELLARRGLLAEMGMVPARAEDALWTTLTRHPNADRAAGRVDTPV